MYGPSTEMRAGASKRPHMRGLAKPRKHTEQLTGEALAKAEVSRNMVHGRRSHASYPDSTTCEAPQYHRNIRGLFWWTNGPDLRDPPHTSLTTATPARFPAYTARDNHARPRARGRRRMATERHRPEPEPERLTERLRRKETAAPRALQRKRPSLWSHKKLSPCRTLAAAKALK